jgi:hypothetical protein
MRIVVYGIVSCSKSSVVGKVVVLLQGSKGSRGFPGFPVRGVMAALLHVCFPAVRGFAVLCRSVIIARP